MERFIFFTDIMIYNLSECFTPSWFYWWRNCKLSKWELFF